MEHHGVEIAVGEGQGAGIAIVKLKGRMLAAASGPAGLRTSLSDCRVTAAAVDAAAQKRPEDLGAASPKR